MNEVKKYTVEILGNQYVVNSDEKQEHIIKSTACIEQYIEEIVEQDAHIEPKKAAILAALRMASQIVSLEDRLHEAQSKGRELVNTLESLLSKAG